MLEFLRTKIFKMAPHVDLISEVRNGAAAPGAKPTAQNSEGKASIPGKSSATPMRDQMSALFEDNITAKIIKTGVNGLVDNVSAPTSSSQGRKC